MRRSRVAGWIRSLRRSLKSCGVAFVSDVPMTQSRWGWLLPVMRRPQQRVEDREEEVVRSPNPSGPHTHRRGTYTIHTAGTTSVTRQTGLGSAPLDKRQGDPSGPVPRRTASQMGWSRSTPNTLLLCTQWCVCLLRLLLSDSSSLACYCPSTRGPACSCIPPCPIPLLGRSGFDRNETKSFCNQRRQRRNNGRGEKGKKRQWWMRPTFVFFLLGSGRDVREERHLRFFFLPSILHEQAETISN